MMKYLNYDIVFREIPNETTLAINITNCPCKCSGCHSPILWDNVGKELDETTVDTLINKCNGGITCVSFMGGDSDPAAVNALAKHCKGKYPSLKVGWYSGFNKISDKVEIKNFDYIKVGPYIEKYGPLDCSTTNQIMYQVTEGELKDITHKFWK